MYRVVWCRWNTLPDRTRRIHHRTFQYGGHWTWLGYQLDGVRFWISFGANGRICQEWRDVRRSESRITPSPELAPFFRSSSFVWRSLRGQGPDGCFVGPANVWPPPYAAWLHHSRCGFGKISTYEWVREPNFGRVHIDVASKFTAWPVSTFVVNCGNWEV